LGISLCDKAFSLNGYKKQKLQVKWLLCFDDMTNMGPNLGNLYS